MATPRETCSDCGGATHEIRIVDRGDHNRHHEVEYALAKDKPSFLTGRYPIAGPVVAFMCASCGRITHYGGHRE
jgi:hypothetical protein